MARYGALAVLLLSSLWATAAVDAGVLLRSPAVSIDAWPQVTMLADPSHTLTLDDALARSGDFTTPKTPHANLGARRDAVWLRVPVTVGDGDPGRWILSIDYASLDRVDVFEITGERPPRHTVMGRLVPFAERPLPSGSHAMVLSLPPHGKPYELVLRVETVSTMIVPLRLMREEAFMAGESGLQVVQGLLAGIALCLLFYSLTQWISLRDGAFLSYALSNFGTALFSLTYFGLASQHIWGNHAWLNVNVAPVAVLLGVAGSFLFVERALGVRDIQPRVARALRAGGFTCFVVVAAFVTGVIDYRTIHVSATLLAPLPMLLMIPTAFKRARRGERVAIYMMFAWGVYGATLVITAGLLRGFLPSNYWTQHMFQMGAVTEMVVWMRVLSLRIEDLRHSAQIARLESEVLRSLALTDALTGLPNRRGLSDALQRALTGCVPERMVGVYLLDLDGFKAINDRLGHAVGDELLIAVARRLESLLRASDMVARLGGDEFVVVALALPGDAEAQALGRKLLEGFTPEFELGSQRCRVGLTIGYALAPLDGHDAATLLRHADASMYAGKHAGRNCLRRDVVPLEAAPIRFRQPDVTIL